MIPGRRTYAADRVAEVNVVPMMTLFMVLVPVLLLAAVFTNMTVLDLALPPAASGESGADVAAPVTPLNLVVVVAEAGVTVGGSGGFLPTVLRVGNVVDLGALASLLATVRSEHPAETRVTVASESAISYEEVVSIMDMCREQGFTEIALCALHESPVAGEGSR